MSDESLSLIPLPGSLRTSLANVTPVGRLDTSERVELTLVLRRRAAPPADVIVRTTALTSDELAERYGADPTDVALVRQTLTSCGLEVTAVHPVTRRMKVAGTLGDLASTFGTALQQVSSPDPGGRGVVTHRYREGALAIPATLDGVVVAVLGLDTRPQAQPHFRTSAVGQGTSYSPDQVADIYQFPVGTTGAGQTIAVIELGGGFATRDLDTYFGGLDITVPSITAISVDRAPNAPGSDPTRADIEVALDIQIIGAAAPGAAQVVYFAPNNDQGFVDAISEAAQATPPPVAISISWGQAEDSWSAQGVTSMHEAIVDAAVLGITVCVAAGDNGSSDGIDDGQVHVDFPASCPHALGCGGTSLRADLATGTVISETVWNGGSGGGAGGGGVSDRFRQPEWQAGVEVQSPAGHPGRGVPDVAGNADPMTGYQLLINGEGVVAGGTGAAASLWAVLICRLAQVAGRPLGAIQQSLYAGARSGETVPGFRDITGGSNGAYSAGPGWDACTGLGVPDGLGLLSRLVPDGLGLLSRLVPDGLGLTRSTSLEAGYDTDDIGSTDWLGITEDVNVLAALIASNRTVPPLSVGLFGDWGTGKSFFMRRLEDRVTILADAARTAAGATPPKPSFYCGHVAQITFNAWHYVEVDLWASLVTRVFEGLSKYLQAAHLGEEPGKAYRELISQLETSQAVLVEAEKRRDAAEETLRGAQKRLNERLAEPGSRTLAQLAELQPELGADVQRLTSTLGKEQNEVRVDDARRVSEDLRRTRGPLRRGWQALSRYPHGRQTRRHLLLVLAGFVVAAALILAWFLARDKPLAATVASAVALLSGAITTLAMLLAWTRKLLSAADQVVQAKDRQEQDAVNASKREIELATDRVRHLEEEVARVQQLEFPTMDSFVQERAISDDYRQHLGLVALIQRDFQALSDLLTAPSHSSSTIPNGHVPPVDRIVLYIDDLDRCPPNKVVQVLQAVHLLLAFRLFVVVVGVDSRWLVRSLEHEYEAILSSDNSFEESWGQADEMASAPLNYLEKIFQIPFWLRPMTPDGYSRLIHALASGSVPTDTSAKDAQVKDGTQKPEVVEGLGPATAGEPEPATAGEPGPATAGEPGPATAQDGSPSRIPDLPADREPVSSSTLIDLTPSALVIADHELVYAEKLGPLIPTPRTAKRLINLYRLLKVGLNERETSKFAGYSSAPGEYQTALLLLAILVGAPAEADTIFRTVRSRGLTSWAQVVDELRPQPWNDPAAADHHSRAAGRLSPSRAAAWHRLCKILDDIGPPVTAQGLDQFRFWADRASRYSFSAGRGAP
jgi:kumamolisin